MRSQARPTGGDGQVSPEGQVQVQVWLGRPWAKHRPWEQPTASRGPGAPGFCWDSASLRQLGCAAPGRGRGWAAPARHRWCLRTVLDVPPLRNNSSLSQGGGGQRGKQLQASEEGHAPQPLPLGLRHREEGQDLRQRRSWCLNCGACRTRDHRDQGGGTWRAQVQEDPVGGERPASTSPNPNLLQSLPPVPHSLGRMEYHGAGGIHGWRAGPVEPGEEKHMWGQTRAWGAAGGAGEPECLGLLPVQPPGQKAELRGMGGGGRPGQEEGTFVPPRAVGASPHPLPRQETGLERSRG